MRSAVSNLGTDLAAVAVAGMLVGCAQGSFAMDLKVAGNQLILSGPVVDGDLGKIENALARVPTIDTVVLRNSPGGHVATGYRDGRNVQGERIYDGRIWVLLFIMFTHVPRR